MSDDPFPPPPHATPLTPNHTQTNTAPNENNQLAPISSQHQPTSPSTVQRHSPTAPATTTQPPMTTTEGATGSQSPTPNSQAQTPANMEILTHQTPTHTTTPQHPSADNTTTPSTSHVTHNNDNIWQQVRRNRSRATNLSTPISNIPPLKKSSSRIRRKQMANKFAPLDFEILPSFEDDDIAPIEVTLSEKPLRPPRRKYRNTKKAFSKQALEAFAHPQKIRHPANTLQFLSPKQAQVMIRSKDPTTTHGRDNLIRQIALIRAARSNTNSNNNTLDPCADDAFMQQVAIRMADCQDPPHCDNTTDIDIPISTILDRDESRVRASMCYAWIDIASRAILPHLYDAWPETPTWYGTTLNWLHSTDGETPCLQDEALAHLAACPSLQNVWQHFATSTPDLRSAIGTASNQWQMFVHEQNTNHTNTPPPPY